MVVITLLEEFEEVRRARRVDCNKYSIREPVISASTQIIAICGQGVTEQLLRRLTR